MLPLATDWSTISSLATGFGTLVLAVATFASVRSANRSARVAELALQEQRRPMLAPSRLEDPLQKIMFFEGKWVRAAGSRGVVEQDDGNVYMAISLRNVGSGIAVCQGWQVSAGLQSSRTSPNHMPVEEFRTQTRDLYIPAGDIGMWQGALRDHGDPAYTEVIQALEAREPITIELLYSDQVGDQRTISRFGLTPMTTSEGEGTWLASGSRHWFLDRDGPRSEAEVQAAAEAILRTQASNQAARESLSNGAQSNGAEAQPERARG
jgi:hypothetical protein